MLMLHKPATRFKWRNQKIHLVSSGKKSFLYKPPTLLPALLWLVWVFKDFILFQNSFTSERSALEEFVTQQQGKKRDGNWKILLLPLPSSVCEVHAHYWCFHHRRVLSCAAVCSLVIVLHGELVKLRPCEPFLSLSCSDLFLTSVSGRCLEPGPLVGPVMLPSLLPMRVCVCVCTWSAKEQRWGGGRSSMCSP